MVRVTERRSWFDVGLSLLSLLSPQLQTEGAPGRIVLGSICPLTACSPADCTTLQHLRCTPKRANAAEPPGLPLRHPLCHGAMGKRRHKRRTHVEPDETRAEKTPKSFVINLGQVGQSTEQLVADMRMVMAPNTAGKLKVRSSNVVKDFVHMAGPLGVSQ